MPVALAKVIPQKHLAWDSNREVDTLKNRGSASRSPGQRQEFTSPRQTVYGKAKAKTEQSAQRGTEPSTAANTSLAFKPFLPSVLERLR